MCAVSVGVCQLGDTVGKPLWTNVATPADTTRGERRAGPTVFCSVMSKLYESGLIFITFSWSNFKSLRSNT